MNVLFVCVENAGRSQMAEVLLQREADGAHQACSAGSDPAPNVHPQVVVAMRELGADLAERVPRPLVRADAEWADVVVTMGCGDACPYVLGKRYVDWEIDDPAGKGLEQTRAIRGEISRRVRALLAELSGGAQ